jgi:hypothetical protein
MLFDGLNQLTFKDSNFSKNRETYHENSKNHASCFSINFYSSSSTFDMINIYVVDVQNTHCFFLRPNNDLLSNPISNLYLVDVTGNGFPVFKLDGSISLIVNQFYLPSDSSLVSTFIGVSISIVQTLILTIRFSKYYIPSIFFEIVLSSISYSRSDITISSNTSTYPPISKPSPTPDVTPSVAFSLSFAFIPPLNYPYRVRFGVFRLSNLLFTYFL